MSLKTFSFFFIGFFYFNQGVYSDPYTFSEYNETVYKVTLTVENPSFDLEIPNFPSSTKKTTGVTPYRYTNKIYVWDIRSDYGYDIIILCPNIFLSKKGCVGSRLLISASEDMHLIGSAVHCMERNLVALSYAHFMSVGYIDTELHEKNATFNCQVRLTKAGQCSCGLYSDQPSNGFVYDGINYIVGIINQRTMKIFCSGTIISPRYVLTAANCISGSDGLQVITRFRGATLSSTVYDTVKFSFYHGYNNYFNHEMAMLKTSRDLDYFPDKGPACLPFRYTNFDLQNASVIASGYMIQCGDGSLNRTGIDGLQIHDYHITNRSDIFTITGKSVDCVTSKGGPIFYIDQLTKRMTIVGVVLDGNFAEPTPTRHAKVIPELFWIQKFNHDVCRY